MGISNRGFASMSAEQRKAIASMGGKAAHAQGRAHEFSSDEARLAGSLGGTAVSQNRDHMREIGRKGGLRGGKRKAPEMTLEVKPITKAPPSREEEADVLGLV